MDDPHVVGVSAPHPDPLILAFGDSLVAGYGLPIADGLATQLEARLRTTRPTARVVNAGVSGDTTHAALRRLPRVLARLDHRPDLAIVQVGPNDVLRQVNPAQSRAALDGILIELARCDVPVLLTTVTPPPILHTRAAPYAGLHAAAARRHGATLHPFFPPGALGHPEMVLPDRVHPNAAAIAHVVGAMLPVVERLLRMTPTGRS